MDNTLSVDFGMERQYVFGALTSDISTADCILDLIDNSIDAARRDIAQKGGDTLENGLPASYFGYEIKVQLKDDEIVISDNCRGMDAELLSGSAFRLAARYPQPYSIGFYGVGLIRAFWKLGNTGNLETDTGAEAFSLHFTKDQLEGTDLSIPANRVATRHHSSFIFRISDLTDDAAYDLSDTEWNEHLLERIRKVYGLCVGKGLCLWVGHTLIKSFGPHPEQFCRYRQHTNHIP